MIIGIEAVNIRNGGGLNHLQSFLNKNSKINFYKKIIIFTNSSTKAKLSHIENIEIVEKKAFNLPYFIYVLYQYFRKDLKNAVELFSNMGIIKDYQKSFFNSLPIRSEGVGLKYSLISLSTLFK